MFESVPVIIPRLAIDGRFYGVERVVDGLVAIGVYSNLPARAVSFAN